MRYRLSLSRSPQPLGASLRSLPGVRFGSRMCKATSNPKDYSRSMVSENSCVKFGSRDQLRAKASTGTGATTPDDMNSNTSIPESRKAGWDKLTDTMVSLCSIPFSVLVLPQVMQNFMNMSAGNSQALAIISWEVSQPGHGAAMHG